VLSSLHRQQNVLLFSTAKELEVGEFEDVKFARIEGDAKKGKYSLSGVIRSKEMNSYLAEYKEEMKRRRVVFPGFRAGKLPPYVMTDVRKYLVSYGLETIIGQLCNINGLAMCGENGEDVPFGEDSYYEQIVLDDFRGFNFIKQRDTWKEGTDFSFTANFFAVADEVEEEGEGKASAIDVEEVKAESAAEVKA